MSQINIVESIPDADTLEKINLYTRKEFNADEVYIFSMKLCDNEIDCDNERFTVESLNKLAKLFIGKIGLINSKSDNRNYTPRIFDCKVCKKDTVYTSNGEHYTYLLAYAFIKKTDENKLFIEELYKGAKKDISIGCTVQNLICNICGTDVKNNQCNHIKGNYYNGKKCCWNLNNPTDAYEWSFVLKPKYKVDVRKIIKIKQ